MRTGGRSRIGTGIGVAVVLAGLLATVACSAGGTTSSSGSSALVAPGATAAAPSTVIPADEGSPRSGGALVFGIDAEPNGLSAITSQFATNSHLIMSSMLETLTVFDKDKKAQPYLAESLTPDEAATKWTIKLKPNITFHDGSPFNAAAAKAALDAQRKGLASIAMKPIDSIDVAGDLTLDVVMNQPWASFPGFLASQQGYMISTASITAEDAETHPVGTGPFVFDRWEHGSKITTKKNPTYWQAGKPYLDRLEFRILNDPTSRAQALESGDLNLLFTDAPQTIANYRDKAGYKAVIDASGDAQGIVMNEGREPFDNVNARKAVAQATDSQAITEAYGEGVLLPTDQPFSETSPYHQTDSHALRFDLDAAKQSVAKYTAETGKPLEFTLTIFTGQANVALAQLLQEQWSAAGITTRIDAIEEATGISKVITGQTQALLGPNFGYPDPDWQYSFWHSSFTGPIGSLSINFPHMKLPELDQALDEGRDNLAPAKRQEAYAKATHVLNDNVTYVWIYRYVAALIAAEKVHGLRQAEQNGFAIITSKPWYQDLWLSQ